MCNIILCCTGSVASIKVPEITKELSLSSDLKVDIKVVATCHSLHFFDRSDLSVPVLCDEDESKDNDESELHVELCDWADVVLIAPLDANSLGKIASGIADNLLTRVVRSWDLTKPLLFAPAMNTLMWEHPLTARQIDVLLGFGFEQIDCIEKTLVCGDTGKGAMATVGTIVSRVSSHVEKLSVIM